MKKKFHILLFLKLARPTQWIKNLMIYFPPFLGGSITTCITLTNRSLTPFLAFCLTSSAIYIVNDVFDRNNDKKHPTKKNRPIASGLISLKDAIFYSLTLLVAGVVLSWSVSLLFTTYLLLYLFISIIYSVKLKEYAFLDIFCISAGFIIRLLAGGVAFDIAISGWLFVCVFLLSFFLSAGKRLSEKRYLGCNAVLHRKVLGGYSKGYLEVTMLLTAVLLIIAYTLYVISRHSTLLLYSIPLSIFGLFRYTLRVLNNKTDADPTESLIRDIPLLITGIIWLAIVWWGIYRENFV